MTFRLTPSSPGWDTVAGSHHWLREVETYGKNAYVNGLLRLIEERRPAHVFDMGIGNGFPFASSLLEKNIRVDGCDVSDFLLEDLRKKYPSVRAFHTSYEHIGDHIGIERYDVAYCLRTSWYLPDLFSALAALRALTKPGGTMVFDTMNSASPQVAQFKKQMRWKKYRELVTNALKWVLNNVARKNYTYRTSGATPHYPVAMETVDAFLEKQNLPYQKLTFSQVSGTSHDFDPHDFRIVYLATVPETG